MNREQVIQDVAMIARNAIDKIISMRRRPLTDEQIHHCFCHVEYETVNDWNRDPEGWCKAFARALEASHGIGEQT